MKIAVMQPYTFPYIGYFQLIHAVDTFVFYDDVNFIKKGFINRNAILVNKERHQFVIPCKGVSQNKAINTIELSFDLKSRSKLLKSIKLAYKKTDNFDIIYPIVEEILRDESLETIADFAIYSVYLVCDYLGITTRLKRSSKDFPISKSLGTSERIIAICKAENATNYINPIGGIELYDKSDFKGQGIDLHFLKSLNVPYQQFDHDFVPWLSIIDVLMFNSKEDISDMLNAFELQ